jgi:hypothetical protein
MHRFIIKLLPFIAFCFLLTIILPVWIDPYNVFHWNNIRDNGIEPNKRYIKMHYILNNPELFDAYLFGSSRVYSIDVDKIEQFHFYNMTYANGLPGEHLENLKTMIQRGIIPAVVLIGVDDISCFGSSVANNLMNKSYPSPPVHTMFTDMFEHLRFLVSYCNAGMLVSSLKTIILYKSPDKREYREQFYKNGSRIRTLMNQEYNWQKAVPANLAYENRIDSCIIDIKNIVDLCDNYDIKLIVFTNPIHVISYQKSVNAGYLDFLYKLSDITDYYNFSGINDITINNKYWFETTHYKMDVGDKIVRVIFNNITDEKLVSQGFGYYVTRHSRDTLFAILKGQIDN